MIKIRENLFWSKAGDHPGWSIINTVNGNNMSCKKMLFQRHRGNKIVRTPKRIQNIDRTSSSNEISGSA